MFDLNHLPEPDADGQFCHPDVPDDELSFSEFKMFCTEHGFDSHFIMMEDDNDDLTHRYSESGDSTVMKDWIPTPPDGEGWIIIAKFDTEDGPVAWFVRPSTMRLFVKG